MSYAFNASSIYRVNLSLVLLLVILLSACSDDNSSNSGRVTEGQILYDANCSSCHGVGGTGGTARAVTGASAALITSAINNIAAMNSISLTTTEIQAIADFLAGASAGSSTFGDQMGGAIQGASLNLATVVTTLAGAAGVPGSTNGTGVDARFDLPFGITTDGINLYTADSHNHIVRQIVIATGEVTTVAGSAGIPGSADGVGTAAQFKSPNGITTDGINLYVADTGNHTVRQIVIASQAVTTVAGMVGVMGIADGSGVDVRFNYPFSITNDGTNLYVTDAHSHTVRQIVIASGLVSTFIGTAGVNGSADGIGVAAELYFPEGITTDGTNLYVADTGNHVVRQIVIASREVTTLAGAGTPGSDDGIGQAAKFSEPVGITTDGTNLYVADFGNHTVRQIVIASREVTTLAGMAGAPGSADGTGLAAQFSSADGITTDGTNLYVADYNNHTVRQIE